jgi:hypothetical protein
MRLRNRNIMNAPDVLKTLHAAESAKVVAVHLEAISHCLLRRNALRRAVPPELAPRLLIPQGQGHVLGGHGSSDWSASESPAGSAPRDLKMPSRLWIVNSAATGRFVS